MFDQRGITPAEVVEARKQKIQDDEAWNILAAADEIVVGRGKKYQVFQPSEENRHEIMKACLGRTGNLRAPALKTGSRMVVGFNEEMYSRYVD